MKPTPSRVYILAVVFALLAVAAIALPKVAAGNEQGLAAGATAALTFLIFAGLAALIAIYLFVISLLARRFLPTSAMVLGLIPLPLCVAGGVYFVWLVIQRAQ